MNQLSKLALLAGSTSILLACGGSGGGSGSGDTGGGNTTPLNPVDIAWVSYSIGADYADEIGITGQGSTVAVLDSGIDWTHEAFQNANIAGNYGTNGIGINDGEGHGTAMASTIVGVYSDGTVFGVAPNTSILNVDSMPDGSDTFADDDIADGIEYAVENGADIISMSLGWDYSDATYYYYLSELAQMEDVQAISYATSQGVIVVMAAGNSYENYSGFPAYFAGDDMYNGLGIAVVALDSNDERAYWGSDYYGNEYGSNSCKTVDPTYCIAAPGDNVTAAILGGGYDTEYDGTSPATAIVAGSFALIKEYFPDLTSEEIVQIVLMTTDDLGAVGVDEIYGSGKINLERALQPVGATTLSNDQNVTEYERAQVVTSSAMSGTFSKVASLSNIPVFDSFDREYALNFSNVGIDTTSSLDNLTTDERYLFAADLTTEIMHQNVTFELAYGDLTDFSSENDTLLNVNTSIDSNPFLTAIAFNGAAKVSREDYSSRSSFTLFADSEEDQTLAMVSHTQYIGNFDIGVGVSRLSEDSQALGLIITDGFGAIDSSTTDSAHLSIGWSNSKFGFDARGSISNTEVDMANAGLITGFEDIQSSSWAVGAHVNSIIRKGDRLDLGVGQSLVVGDGSAILDASVLADDASNEVSLTPSGKETTYEIGYRTPIADNIALLMNAAYLTEANNDADAEDEAQFGVTVEFTF